MCNPCATTVGSSGALFGLMGAMIPYCLGTIISNALLTLLPGVAKTSVTHCELRTLCFSLSIVMAFCRVWVVCLRRVLEHHTSSSFSSLFFCSCFGK